MATHGCAVSDTRGERARPRRNMHRPGRRLWCRRKRTSRNRGCSGHTPSCRVVASVPMSPAPTCCAHPRPRNPRKPPHACTAIAQPAHTQVTRPRMNKCTNLTCILNCILLECSNFRSLMRLHVARLRTLRTHALHPPLPSAFACLPLLRRILTTCTALHPLCVTLRTCGNHGQ